MATHLRLFLRVSIVCTPLLLAALSAGPVKAQNTDPANKVRGMDHLVINVTDMERALAFYKRLGFRLNNEDGWRRGEGQVSIQIGADQKINIHKEEPLGPRLKQAATGAGDQYSRALVPVAGNADFCLVWDGTFEEAQRFLKDKGVQTFTRQVTAAKGPSDSVYFRDPDGNLWEFTVYPR